MGKFSEYNVPLRSLSPGVHQFEYHLGVDFFQKMENNDIHGSDLNVKLTVTYSHDIYDLQFEISGEVVLICDRCLDDLHYPLEASYRIKVEYGPDYNDDNDDLLIIPVSDPDLNVSYMIYDTVVLAIPSRHVHPMGKCNRQMSAILRKHRSHPQGEDGEIEQELIDEMDSMDQGADNGDPRWDALKGFNPED